MAIRALEDGQPHLCASRAYRAMHALACAALATRGLAFSEDAETLAAFEAGFVASGHLPPALSAGLRHAQRLQRVADCQPAEEVPAEEAQAVLENAQAFCYTLRDSLTKWKQGRALQ